MGRKTCKSMVTALSSKVRAALSGGMEEVFPWEFLEGAQSGPAPLLLDIRSPFEFEKVHIRGSINVPRGILETACNDSHQETVPELVEARDRLILVICVSGKRSIPAARILVLLGYSNVVTLRTGLRGWNDYGMALYNNAGERLDPDRVEVIFSPSLSAGRVGEQQQALA